MQHFRDPPNPDVHRGGWHGRFVPILLQKSVDHFGERNSKSSWGWMLFNDERVILTAPAGRPLENDEKRDHGERRDHQQLEIVDVSNDLRLVRDHRVECGASGGGERIPELLDHRVLE
jgi:hypothetical protein